MMRRTALAVALLPLIAAGAQGGALRQQDPAEQRLQAISVALRCPVCQGESVYDSHSAVASQMKALIREQVLAGKSDDEIKSFFVDRYGEFILMEPGMSLRTILVWAFPAAAFLVGSAVLLLLLLRRRASGSTADLAAISASRDTADLINRIERLGP